MASEQALTEWRGRISEQVRSHEQRFERLNGDLRNVHQVVEGLRVDTVKLQGQIAEARSDIAANSDQQAQARVSEISDLKDVIRQSRQTPISIRDLWLHFALPAIVTVLGALTVVLVGHAF